VGSRGARVAWALATVALLGSLAACGGGGDDEDGGLSGGDAAGDGQADDTPTAQDPVVLEGDEVAVTSLDNTFRAPVIQVQPGTTVVWSNRGRNQHDVLPVEGDAWGVDISDFQPGDTYSHTFDEPGTYPYYCSIHGTTTTGMVGSVVVAE
jgi:plastocyanin